MPPLARRTLAPALALAALAAGALHAQTRVQLPPAEREHPESFDRINSLRELPDGRVLVADVAARAVILADLKAGTSTKIGREGSGPNEYQFPRQLVPMPNGETWVADVMQRRFLKLRADGTPNGTVAFPAAMGGVATVKGADTQGRIYFQGSAIRFGDGPPEVPAQTPDTVPVLRWDPKANTLDTLARVKVPSLGITTGGTSSNRSVMIRQQPWSPEDDWGVTPAGELAIARVGDYHVDRVRPGAAPVRGPAVGHGPVKVTAKDREEYLARARDPRGRMVINRGGPPPAGAQAPRLAEPQVDFPETKPPFVAQASHMAPDGQFWVRRSAPAGEPAVYDVFDAKGAPVRQVVLPKGLSVVGVSATSVYTSRQDEDELVYLARHRRP